MNFNQSFAPDPVIEQGLKEFFMAHGLKAKLNNHTLKFQGL